jgi:hypothetical protein
MIDPMQPAPPIGRADLHIHPSGDAAGGRMARAVYAALRTSDLQVAVLADHDRLDVARELVARSLDDGIATTLVVGEEVTTRGGHLLGIGLTAPVPAWRSLPDTVAAVHDQGGMAVVAHPLLAAWVSASANVLADLAQGDDRRRPDALETMHPLALWIPGWRRRVERLAQSCGYAVVGGSDAHVARSIGRARTCFRGATAADLMTAIRGRTTWTEGRAYSVVDFVRRYQAR